MDPTSIDRKSAGWTGVWLAAAAALCGAAVLGGMAGTAWAAEARRATPALPLPVPAPRGLQPVQATLPAPASAPDRRPPRPAPPADDGVREHWRHHGVG